MMTTAKISGWAILIMIKYEDFNNDFSTLTGMSLNSVFNADKKRMALVCSYLNDAVKNGENEISVDIGIGDIVFIIEGDKMKYRFIPSLKFERMIVDTIVDGVNPLTKMLEERCGEETLRIYKELL